MNRQLFEVPVLTSSVRAGAGAHSAREQGVCGSVAALQLSYRYKTAFEFLWRVDNWQTPKLCLAAVPRGTTARHTSCGTVNLTISRSWAKVYHSILTADMELR